MNLFWRAIAVGATACFIALHVPFLTGLLAWAAVAWSAYWYTTQAGRSATWLAAAGVGAGALAAGTLINGIVASALGAPGFLALGRLPALLLIGAACGLAGWLFGRNRRRPWRRWDLGE